MVQNISLQHLFSNNACNLGGSSCSDLLAYSLIGSDPVPVILRLVSSLSHREKIGQYLRLHSFTPLLVLGDYRPLPRCSSRSPAAPCALSSSMASRYLAAISLTAPFPRWWRCHLLHRRIGRNGIQHSAIQCLYGMVSFDLSTKAFDIHT